MTLIRIRPLRGRPGNEGSWVYKKARQTHWFSQSVFFFVHPSHNQQEVHRILTPCQGAPVNTRHMTLRSHDKPLQRNPSR